MRIGPDVAFATSKEPQFPSIVTQARHVAFRAHTDAWWSLDPDVVLLRGTSVGDADAWTVVVLSAMAGGNYPTRLEEGLRRRQARRGRGVCWSDDPYTTELELPGDAYEVTPPTRRPAGGHSSVTVARHGARLFAYGLSVDLDEDSGRRIRRAGEVLLHHGTQRTDEARVEPRLRGLLDEDHAWPHGLRLVDGLALAVLARELAASPFEREVVVADA